MGSMSAEVSSFSKRAAAELSRCFNGISTSVSSSSSSLSLSSSSRTTSSASPPPAATILNKQQSSATLTSDFKQQSQQQQNVSNPTINNNQDNNQKINAITATTTKTQDSMGQTTTIKQQGLTNNNNNNNLSSNNNNNTEEKQLPSSITTTKSTSGTTSTTTTSSTSGFSVRTGTVFGGAFRGVFKNSEKLLSPLKSNRQQPASSGNNVGVSKIPEQATTTASVTNNSGGVIQTPMGVPMTPSKLRKTSKNGPPPKAPPKTNRARRKNYLLNLPKKPIMIVELFLDENFLQQSFFKYFNAIEYCYLSQVCKTWFKILYSDRQYWNEQLLFTINYSQLRQLEKQQFEEQQQKQLDDDNSGAKIDKSSLSSSTAAIETSNISQNNLLNKWNEQLNIKKDDGQQFPIDKCFQTEQIWAYLISSNNNYDDDQIVRNHRKRIYHSIRLRGFETICLQAPSDNDLVELVEELSSSSSSLNHIIIRNGTITDNALEVLLTKFTSTLQSFELIGCNELTNSGLWSGLVPNLTLLTIQDCINISDDTVATLCQFLTSLQTFQFQAYHVTDIAMAYFSTSMMRQTLKVLTLQHCWEITNQGVANVAHSLPNLQSLSLSGCSKITDDAIEVVAEQLRNLQSLDLSWCPRISDAALEYIACDLADSLRTLVLDRCLHITDIGLGYLATMANLEHLSVRWCPQIRDFGLQALTSLRSLKTLSIAGCIHVSITGLSFITRMRQLEEIELTNCPAANRDLLKYLSESLPETCTIII